MLVYGFTTKDMENSKKKEPLISLIYTDKKRMGLPDGETGGPPYQYL